MRGAEQWLIEAIAKKQLVEYTDPMNNVRTCEPHLYALGAGNREILIVYQVDVGAGSVANEQLWKIVEADRVSPCSPVRLFSKTRAIPAQHAERVRQVYAQSSDADRSRKGSAPR
jgi:hypothetical protein